MADGIHDGVPERNSPYRQPVFAKQNQLGGRKSRMPKAKSTPLTVFFSDGRRETLTIGRYGADGVSLSEARDRCLAARKEVSEGRSPAQAKQRAKRKLAISQNFGAVGKRWFKDARMAESTRSMRRAIFDRDIVPLWKYRLLTEITVDDLRALCLMVNDSGELANS